MYKHLVHLEKTYGEKGVTFLFFPCNQFGGQEPWPVPQILEWAEKKYGVSETNTPNIIMMDKVEVNGPKTHPVFHFCKTKQPGIGGSTAIKWNFGKFLVDREGNVVSRVAPKDTISEEALKALL